MTESGELLAERPTVTVLSSSSTIAQSLKPLGGGGGGGGPVTGSAPYAAAKLPSELAEKMEKLIEKGIGTVTGIVSVVGIAGALLQVLELAGVFGEQTSLDDVLEEVKRNYTATREAARISHLQNIADLMGVVTASKNALDAYRLNQSAPNRKTVLDFNTTLAAAVQSLLDPAYQQVIFNPEEHKEQSWFWDQGFFEVSPESKPLVEKVEAKYPGLVLLPVSPYSMLNEAFGRFDYRFVLGSVVTAVTTRLAWMKVVEPEFRSTRRFLPELQDIVRKLRALQHQWLLAIQDTFNPLDEGSEVFNDLSAYGSDFFGRYYIPTGCIDACTGLGVYSTQPLPYWKTGTPPYMGPMQERQKLWQAAFAPRREARQQILQDSGYAKFAAFVAMVESLAGDPPDTETVSISEGMVLSRELLDPGWWKRSEGLRKAGGVSCEEKTFPSETWEKGTDPSVKLVIRTQSPESIETFAIFYEYSVNGGGTLTPLTPAAQAQTVPFRPRLFTRLVGPAGERHEFDMPSQPVTLTFRLTVQPGVTELVLSIPKGFNARFSVWVRERIQSGAEFLSVRDVELVSVREHVPTEWFQHERQCGISQAAMVSHVNRQVRDI